MLDNMLWGHSPSLRSLFVCIRLGMTMIESLQLKATLKSDISVLMKSVFSQGPTLLLLLLLSAMLDTSNGDESSIMAFTFG